MNSPADAQSEDDALHKAIVSLRSGHTGDTPMTAKEVHALLVEAGWQLSLAEAKRACSKAAKRAAKEAESSVERAEPPVQVHHQRKGQRGREAAHTRMTEALPEGRLRGKQSLRPIDFLRPEGMVEMMQQMMQAESEDSNDGEMPERFRQGCGSPTIAADQPQSDEVWFAGYYEACAGLPDFERKIIIFLVQDEQAQGSRPWPEGDGLGLILSSLVEGRRYEAAEHRVPGLARAVISACCHPGWNCGFPAADLLQATKLRRPRRVLAANGALTAGLRIELQALGVKVHTASKSLVESFIAGAAAQHASQARSEAAGADNEWPDGLQGMGESLLNQVRRDKAADDAERRACSPANDPPAVKLPRRLRDELVRDGGLPAEWFVRVPGMRDRVRQCWGWRTLFEDALLRGDVDAARAISAARPRHVVLEFVEMRIVLTRVAQKGLISVCGYLLREVGCAVDGVQAPTNRTAWRLCQKGAGDDGNAEGSTPYLAAVLEAEDGVAKLLLEANADPNLRSPLTKGTALHFASARSPQSPKMVQLLLSDPRTNKDARDKDGNTPLELARAVDEWQGSFASARVLSLLSDVDTGATECCSACGARPARLKHCACGAALYCDSACQKRHWKEHKRVCTKA